MSERRSSATNCLFSSKIFRFTSKAASIWVVVLFSIIQTFADFQLVYVLTGGGPANSTQLFATYAYQIGVGTGLLSQGAAISLAMFPVLLVVVIVQLLYIRRVETH
jgi:multiple sugar transport system permease protein